MLNNSLFKFLFCPGLAIAMLSWQVFQTVPSNTKIQGINVCLQNHLWLCNPLPKFITSDLCALRSFRSASESHFIVPFQRGTTSLSQTFKLNVPSLWNDLPNSIPAVLQESAKKTLSSLFDPLTLALSIRIIFLNKNTHLSNIFVSYLFVVVLLLCN